MSRDLTLDDYRKCLAINKYTLDDEFVEQADIFYRVSEAAAIAVSVRDAAKDTLARGKAQLELELRKDAVDSKVRVTDKEILANVEADEGTLVLTTDYLDKRTDADLWFALKESFIQRSYMLRNLGSIYIAGYYSDRIVTGDNKQSSDTAYAMAQKKLTDIRNERRSAPKKKRKKLKKR